MRIHIILLKIKIMIWLILLFKSKQDSNVTVKVWFTDIKRENHKKNPKQILDF